MSTPLGQVHQGRDGETQLYKLTNEMRRYFYRGPGVFIAISDETIAAFSCVAVSTTTGNVVLARADGTNYASGLILNSVVRGELATVITQGTVAGALSGATAGQPFWVGADGRLAIAPPGGSNYNLRIATAENSTDVYVGPNGPGSIVDSASFHFYINDTTTPAGLSGVIAPSSSTTITTISPGFYLGWCPSTTYRMARGSLQLNVITNTMAGVETYAVQVIQAGVASLTPLITLTSGTAGLQTASFNITSFTPNDIYYIQISSNANSKTIEYALVLRLYGS